MLRVLVSVIPIVLAIYALVDLVQTDTERIKGLPQLAWVALIVLIPIVGPVAWLIAGKKRTGRPGRGTQPRGPVGPDDDPDFLRNLRPPKPPRDEEPPQTPA